MSWEVSLLVAFADKINPIQQFIKTADAFSSHGKCEKILSLSVYEKNLRTEILHLDTGISFDKISQILHPYQGDNLAVGARWRLIERYELDEVTRNPIQETYRVSIEIWDSQFYHSSFHPDINMIYYLGDQKSFLKNFYGEAVELNINSALQEITLLTTLNTKTIQGINEDNDENPETFFLCYQKDPDDFRKDLNLIHGQEANYKHLEKGDVLQAIEHCQNIRVLDTDNGLIVYHKDFVEGSLGEFYQELEKVAKA